MSGTQQLQPLGRKATQERAVFGCSLKGRGMSERTDLHEMQAASVTRAVANLAVRFGPQGFTPEAIFEGAVKGAAVQMLAIRGCSTKDIADLLIDLAQAFNDVAQSNPAVVQ